MAAAAAAKKPRGYAAYQRRLFTSVRPRATAVFNIDKRYTTLSILGEGAYGLVCSAVDTVAKRKVAIKKVADVFQDLVDAKRILREILLLKHLGAHPNITTIYDLTIGSGPIGADFRDLYIITDLYECDLERIISSSQALTRPHIQYFLYQMLNGLAYIHSANVLHRDLKPSNILVNSNCDLAICDFGLSRGACEGAVMTDYVVTRWYRAPEILLDNEKYGKAVDVWSCGLIFVEMILRKPLLRGKDYVHQIRLIVKLLGKPSAEDLQSITVESAKDAIRRLSYPGLNFEEFFSMAKPDAVHLIKQMLRFDHRKRITVEGALKSVYMSELYDPGSEILCDKPFDSSFEAGYKDEMPKKLMQNLISTEACLFSAMLEKETASRSK